MPARMSQDEFIEKLIIKHGDDFDFSKTVFNGTKKDITFKCSHCPKEFTREAGLHLRKSLACECEKIRKYTEKANEVNKGKFDYSKTVFGDSNTIIHFSCKQCGKKHSQKASDHTHRELKCECRKITALIVKSKELFGPNHYIYDKCVFVNARTAMTFTCTIEGHGDFQQSQDSHFKGIEGCLQCVNSKKTEKFKEDAQEVHDETYDYTKTIVVFKGAPVTIICRVHGEFTQTPSNHLAGEGCKSCYNLKQKEENAKKRAKKKQETLTENDDDDTSDVDTENDDDDASNVDTENDADDVRTGGDDIEGDSEGERGSNINLQKGKIPKKEEKKEKKKETPKKKEKYLIDAVRNNDKIYESLVNKNNSYKNSTKYDMHGNKIFVNKNNSTKYDIYGNKIKVV